jgi:phosphonopyruvate decarboxylase
MISAASFVEPARERGFALYTGVPCAFLTPVINYVIDADNMHYVGAANEGDAVAIAAGAQIGGMRSVVMFQNSGLGNAINPLTSLTNIFKIPTLLITTLRGDPVGPADEPQHELMGAITTGMLELMQIPWEYFPTEESEIAAVLDRAIQHMDANQSPYALVMKKGSVGEQALKSQPQPRTTFACDCAPMGEPQATRHDMLHALQAVTRSDDVVFATTGFMGRELYACDDRDSQFYMVGSMGCVSSLALGLAIAQPQRRVIAVDGDGAMLMRMGALATLGYERPSNLVHLLFDNERHESTGGQSTVSHSIDFCAIASACGYPHTTRATSVDEVKNFVEQSGGQLSFLHAKILPGVADDVPRPSATPAQVGERLRRFVEATQ